MEDSSSGSCSPDLEDCILESKSNESLSVGYFPYEDSTDCEEEIIPCEDLTSEGSSCHSLPPVQGAWGTESVRRPMGRRNEIQENPENLGQEAITKDLDAHLDCDGEDSVGHQALSENDQIMDGCAQERISQTIGELDDPLTNTCAFLDNQRDDKDDDPVLTDSSQEEDLQPFRNLSPLLDLVSHQEHETCQDLPKCKPLENGVIQQFLEKTRCPEEDEIIEVSTEQPHCRAADGNCGDLHCRKSLRLFRALKGGERALGRRKHVLSEFLAHLPLAQEASGLLPAREKSP
ncbi:uncharacterized protein C12orf71 homolog [Sciurus carolinensis]|uniref:uncharacterized protein C12orf71 homolog n=1 Tax=Sciurus carolinensis TaxID=30640 RepID=UPI001FB4D812|nr:uncharacterized protein C12orf71 homolog [Sciurus carolinensis]